ncbi:MAG TPA: AMP-binding protein, partial [Vineibacter sp.]|nr:AMP-binding protein [Vineibacter sp.]
MSDSVAPPRIVFQHTIGDILRRTARRYPDKPAIICGDVAWTYAQFDSISNRLAHGLAAQGVALGDRVAVLSRNSHAFAAMRFALARLGAVLVPINFMLNAEEIAFILRASGAKALCVGPDFVALGRAAAALDTSVQTLFWLPGEEPAAPPADLKAFDQLLTDNESRPDVEIDNRLLAQIVYTSGTESLPKGAMLTHEAILWEYVSCVIEEELTPRDSMLHALPLYHCAQLDTFLGPAIYVGMTNIITGQPKPEVILPLIARHRITAFFAPPSVWIA